MEQYEIETNNYVALIGDIIDSKSINDRLVFQENLKQVLNQLNHRFDETLVSNLTLTLGDEFQCLCRDAKTALLIIDLLTLKYLQDGIAFRFGLGIGTIITDINSDISIGADGPAYWAARSAIEFVYKENDNGNTSSYLAYMGDKDHNAKITFYNSIIKLQDAMRNNWTQTQREFAFSIIDLYEYDEFVSKDLAQKLKFSAAQVSNRVASTRIRQYTESRVQLAFHIGKELLK